MIALRATTLEQWQHTPRMTLAGSQEGRVDSTVGSQERHAMQGRQLSSGPYGLTGAGAAEAGSSLPASQVPASLEWLLACRRVLLLQGPMGPFFSRLAQRLRGHGAKVWKVNFNAGDDLFYAEGDVVRFRETEAQWPARLGELVRTLHIDAIVLFGQTRVWHAEASAVAQHLGLALFVFEEGYVRPDYITLELGGVNAYSTISQDAAFYRQLPPTDAVPPPLPTGQRFRHVMRVAMRYSWATWRGRRQYPNYRHHRDLSPLTEGPRWWRGAARKWWYRFADQGHARWLVEPATHKQYYLVPLQVHNDSQILHHSGFGDVVSFIETVLQSFARHAPPGTTLVIKHHPLDRPYNDYAALLRRRAAALGLTGRVRYVHDLHLPTLIKGALGVVTVNSTTGLQALYHGTPVITLGESLYALPGLVFQGPLDAFWADPGTVDDDLFQRFRTHLIRQTQLNGSFYGACPALDEPASEPPATSAVQLRSA